MAWGIDFGTTTTQISLFGKSGLEVAKLGSVEKWIPSLAALSGSKSDLVFGEAADAQAPNMQITGVKRAITEGNLETLLVNRQNVKVDDVILGILRQARTIADKKLGLKSESVRFACPAGWDGPRRERLHRLIEAAGFVEERHYLLDEPVAACISWVEEQRLAGNPIQGRVLVFDMGGGTLDIAVIKVDTSSANSKPKFFVMAARSIPIAGEVFDEVIAKHLVENLSTKKFSVEQLERDMHFVKRAAKDIKERLSRVSEFTGKYRLGSEQEIDFALSRAALDDVIEDTLESVWRAVSDTMLEARLVMQPGKGSWESGVHREAAREPIGVDYVVLAGGMAHMPAIGQMFSRKGVVPESRIHIAGGKWAQPSESVSRGLVDEVEMDSLSMVRPPVHIEISWKERFGSRKGVSRIYEAYSPLFNPDFSDPVPIFRHYGAPIETGSAELYIVSAVDGKREKIRLGHYENSKGGNQSGAHVRFDARAELDSVAFSLDTFKHFVWAPGGLMMLVGSGGVLARFMHGDYSIMGTHDGSLPAVTEEAEPYRAWWWEDH